MKELVMFLARSVAKNPDLVNVTEAEKNGSTLIELRTAPEDRGRVIGKNGRTIKAIRTILNAAASAGKKKVSLEIPDNG